MWGKEEPNLDGVVRECHVQGKASATWRTGQTKKPSRSREQSGRISEIRKIFVHFRNGKEAIVSGVRWKIIGKKVGAVGSHGKELE